MLREGEVLVYGAAHVTPEYLKEAKLEIDVFAYDDALTPGKPIRHAARLLRAEKRGNADVACLAFTPDSRCKITPAPVAGEKRWFSRRVPYMRVGCRGGEPPHFELTYPVQAMREDRGGYVTVDIQSMPGDSGGGLFDPDGFLMAICSASSEEQTSMLVGQGLLEAETRIERALTTSTFAYAHNAVKLAAAGELAAQEEARWASIFLPRRHPDFGAPMKASEGLAAARRAIEASIDDLPPERRKEVRQKFAEALDAYENALKQK